MTRNGWSDVPDLAIPEPDQWELGNGLRVRYLAMPGRGVVTTALCYRAGTADEERGQEGVAHFLEHMMFKGSSKYGEGDIDRRTQALGGWNNAYTSHDATMYHFDFARDRWQEAVAIEADRMRGLTLDPRGVEAERRVILEELSMVLDDPWDALDLDVGARLFGDHPYGRPVLGSSEALREIDRDELHEFHRRYYLPANAVLAVAGDVDRREVEDVVEREFGAFVDRSEPVVRPAAPAMRCARSQRLEAERGTVARLLLAFPGPAGKDPDLAVLSLAAVVLAGGRASRLERELVEDLEICSSVAAEVTEMVDGGAFSIAAEVMPDVEPALVEREILRHVAMLADEPLDSTELERARAVLLSDWVFSHERVHQRALAIAVAEAVFDSRHSARWLAGVVDCTPQRLLDCAGRFLSVERGSVLGWSLPTGGSQEA